MHNVFIFKMLFYIKNNVNCYMFQTLRDHRQGVCTLSTSVLHIKKVIYKLLNPDFLHIIWTKLRVLYICVDLMYTFVADDNYITVFWFLSNLVLLNE
jgi:hypothetical protein